MKLIVGLGNPGKKYLGTRHNAGFMFVDELVSALTLSDLNCVLNFKDDSKFEAEICQGTYKGEKLVFVKPKTYMNLSGAAVAAIMKYYDFSIKDLIVVSDDVDLPIGQARVRHDGSSGGQKGLQNIIDSLGTNDFLRLRIGISAMSVGSEKTLKMDNLDTANFVLSKFATSEKKYLKDVFAETIGYILPYLSNKENIPAHTINIKSIA